MAHEDLDLRASDAERDVVVARLREHAVAGRLDVAELDERVSVALAARTRRDLEALERDLPRLHRSGRDRSIAPRAPAVPRHVREYLAVMTLLVAIWAVTGGGYFWPVWPMVGWGLALGPGMPGCRTRRSTHRAPTRRTA